MAVVKRRSTWIAGAIIFLFTIAGGMFGPSITGASAASTVSSDADVNQSLKSFTKVLSVVEDNFADKVSPDKTIYKGAIPGMARTLDPHTSFFDPKEFQALRDDQRGHYYGVGMSVAPRNGKTIVIVPFPGSPAYKAGIRPGDAILEVNDKRTDNLSTTEVADLLKGPRGTPGAGSDRPRGRGQAARCSTSSATNPAEERGRCPVDQAGHHVHRHPVSSTRTRARKSKRTSGDWARTTSRG